jgi:hypothetical protein
MLIKGKFSSNLTISYIIVRNMNKLALCFAAARLLLKKRRDGIKPLLARFGFVHYSIIAYAPNLSRTPAWCGFTFLSASCRKDVAHGYAEEIVERGAALPAPYSAMSPSR